MPVALRSITYCLRVWTVSRIREPHRRPSLTSSLSLTVKGLQPGDARGVYKNTQMDMRIYKRLQMWTHAEALIDNKTDLKNGDLAMFIRLGSDVKNNYYEYEIPLDLTPPWPLQQLQQP